jgi:AcrR family transcriptional regulator
MSLYRYVDGKDDLIDLMIDEVYGEATCEPHSGNWRTDLAQIACDIRSVTLRHPWLANARYPTARPTFGPNLLWVFEHTLAAVDGIGLDLDGMHDAWMTVNAFVQGYVMTELADHEATRRTNLTRAQWRARIAPYVRRIVESGRYPLFTRVVVDAEDFPDPDVTFERRLGLRARRPSREQGAALNRHLSRRRCLRRRSHSRCRSRFHSRCRCRGRRLAAPRR